MNFQFGRTLLATSWIGKRQSGLEKAIERFKRDLPGWWYSVGECQVSCDASCGPTREASEIKLIAEDTRFDSGFHVDMDQPATLADALDDVRCQALEAVRENRQARIVIAAIEKAKAELASNNERE